MKENIFLKGKTDECVVEIVEMGRNEYQLRVDGKEVRVHVYDINLPHFLLETEEGSLYARIREENKVDWACFRNKEIELEREGIELEYVS